MGYTSINELGIRLQVWTKFVIQKHYPDYTCCRKNKKASYIFDGSDIDVKSFSTIYELTNIFDIDLDRLILSAPVICNKNNEQYVTVHIGYKKMYDNIVPLYVKLPINCYSNGVSQYNQNSTWKMGLDISNDKEWMEMYKVIWKEV